MQSRLRIVKAKRKIGGVLWINLLSINDFELIFTVTTLDAAFKRQP